MSNTNEIEGTINKGASSAHFLKLLEETGGIGLWSWDFSTDDVNGSPGFHIIHGTSPQLVKKGYQLLELVHPDDRHIISQLNHSFLKGQTTERQLRLLRGDGSVRHVVVKTNVVLDSDGQPTRAIGTVIDLTPKHELQSALEFAEGRFFTIARHIPAVVCSISSAGMFSDISGWHELTGQTYTEMINDGWLSAVSSHDRERVRDGWAVARATLDEYVTVLRIFGRNEREAQFVMGFYPIPRATVKTSEWICILLPSAIGTNLVSDVLSTKANKNGDVKPVLIRSMPELLRGGRALLNWSILELSKKAKVSTSTIKRMESSLPQSNQSRIIYALQKALEDGGVDFVILPDGRVGQTLRQNQT